MNGRDSSLDIGINGRKTKKWILSQWGAGVEGGERSEFVNTIPHKAEYFLSNCQLRLDGWLGRRFCR
jgi:hypothetical protein